MFLLDNAVVRESWNAAKAAVTDVLEKHGAKVTTIRRWEERKLAYPIRNKLRGTYALCYYEMGNENIAAMRREFDLSERVLRYLILRTDEVPATELELHAAEQAADFVVPPPPPDDMVEPDPVPAGLDDDDGSSEVLVPDLDDEGDVDDDDRPRGKKSESRDSEDE
ncbi:MAG: 30S ribosomal protein S6 [Planctomycetes bacterium]|nr:30S ribosomal protein S6 [Planctomycetota bacterium]